MILNRSSINYEKIYHYSILLFACTLPLSRAIISFFIIWFVLIWIIEGNFTKKFQQLWQSTLFRLITFFVLLQITSILWSTDTKEALHFIRLYSYWLVIPVLATSIKREWIHPVITAFLLGMIVSEILAYGIYFEFWTINGHGPDYPSPFMFHIDYSVFLAFTAILLLNRLFSSRYNLQEKFLLLLFFISVSGNLFISIGRTGQVAFLAATFIATILHFRLSIKSFIIFILTGTLLFGAAYLISPNFQKRVTSAQLDIEKLSNQGSYNTSLGLRAAFWIISWDIIKENPLLGVGSGDYKLAAQEMVKSRTYPFTESVKEWLGSWHYHNQYLMIIVQSGILGLLLMFALLIQMYRLDIKDRELKELSVLFTTIFAISFLTEPLWIKQFTLSLFILFSGLMIAASHNTKRVEDASQNTPTSQPT